MEKSNIEESKDISLSNIISNECLINITLSKDNTEYAINNIANFSKEQWIAKRDVAILTLIYGSGLRISEILSITKKHLKEEIIRIVGEDKKERIVPWIDYVKNSINDYLSCIPYEE
jgi:integrase/recombinase XerC